MMALATTLLLLLLLFFSTTTLCASFSTTSQQQQLLAPQAAVARKHHHHHDDDNHLVRCITSTSTGATTSAYHHRRVLCMSTTTDNDSQSSSHTQRTSSIIDEFISTVLTSLQDKTFESFTLKGPPAPRKKRLSSSNNKSATNTEEIDSKIEKEKEALRGKYKTILGRLVFLQDKKKRRKKKDGNDAATDVESGSLYLQVTIKYHLATDIAQNWKIGTLNDDDNITLDVSEVESGLRGIFGSAVPLSEWGATTNKDGELDIRAGELVADRVYELQLHGKKPSFRPSKTKNKNKEKGQPQLMNDPTQLSHDRTKNVPLSTSSEFFQKLGVTNADGKPKVGMASKLRQCQKFVEIVSNLVDTSYYRDSPNNNKSKNIRVIDMGCGRGYLTFSLHSYLSDKYNDDSSSCVVETQGIERRPKLVREINGIARELGKGKFEELNFIEGAIGETDNSLFGDAKLHQNVENKESVDIVIALHACDTATDDALWFAIERDVDVIVTAPCCQHELRSQIDRHVSSNPNHILANVLRFPIYRERATEQTTDSMRAILLEIAGYDVQVFEFIGGEHTAKNSCITATKKVMSGSKKDDAWLQERRKRLVELAELYGVKRQRLASLMGESITSSPDLKVKVTGGMPPLR
jgi:SAM-dependent methyltransferase